VPQLRQTRPLCKRLQVEKVCFIFLNFAGQLQEDVLEVIPEMKAAGMTGEADQEALDADTQDPALDQMIAEETVASMADAVMTAEIVVGTEEIVPIAETEITDAQDLPRLVGIEAAAHFVETTRSLTNHISLRTTPRPRSTTTINLALLFATIDLLSLKL